MDAFIEEAEEQPMPSIHAYANHVMCLEVLASMTAVLVAGENETFVVTIPFCGILNITQSSLIAACPMQVAVSNANQLYDVCASPRPTKLVK